MLRTQREKMQVCVESTLIFLDNAWRQSHPRNRMAKVAFLVTAWLLVMIALFHQFFDQHSDLTSQSTIQDTKIPGPINKYGHSPFPRKIWQIYLTPPNANKSTFHVDPGNIADAVSWLAHNPDYEYTLVGEEGAETIVRYRFKEQPVLLGIFNGLRNTGMKSDLLRYLILSTEGGIYSDIDTENLKPIDKWVPERYQKEVRVVVGVEFDRLNGNNWAEVHPDLQFCQWTIATTPGHPLFTYMIEWVVSALEEFRLASNTTYSKLSPSSSEVMKLTGPSAWTDAVFRHLQSYDSELVSLRNLSGLTEPKLIGDILILPIDGFGVGQGHSNSTHDGTIPEDALVRHKFRGSWRHEDKI
ncbi:hypothetical protein N7532_003364 [Penicillium argentinense]|uniref:Initiation-specific alpha-1,6-mannosyltransferase n=1 Tax=Penicillium argentinense TaxID=1131581 RepID=A0A9W9FMA9_9EURO|nr:uncharacterized protein N7532_003364 [Penicillium argentinense]KAJ5102835.1 hypothetical protein N7532_003364 [Penicillium argentinense]